LEKEGKDVKGLYKVNLDKAIDALKLIATDLSDGKKVSLNTVREMVANAEINVAHDYLSSDETYVLDEPEQAASRRTTKKFNDNLANLKKEEGKMKEDAKKEGEALLKEGKKLEEDYKAWEKKAAEYAKKTDEHFKKYYPTYYQQNYWMY
jgi:predicted  nucleic acid-binding Zn-ribbon protein